MKNISIVIPIHNRLSLTQKGIKSLYDSLTYYKSKGLHTFNFTVIVVDDGSTDGSSEWLAKHYPDIKILLGDGNLWWTGAINKGSQYGVEELNADFVILWNDDTQCEISYFVELDRLFLYNPEYQSSILAAKIFWLNEANLLFNFGCRYSYQTGRKRVIGLNQQDSEHFNQIIPIDWSGGMGTVIPAKILTELGYFDAKSFPQYHGDIDFFLRANKRGYQAFAVPTMKIYNNRDSTGVSRTRNFEDFRKLFLSNRSNYNIYQNFLFNYRHSNTIFSWSYFISKYLVLTSQSLRTIVWP